MNILTTTFDFFLPRFCLSCGNKLNANENTVCAECFSKIKVASKERLIHEFNKKFASKKIITDFHSLFVFEKDKELQKIIHALKYNHRFLTGKFMGEILAGSIKDKLNEWKVELIIPVPLHQLKKFERGYNQSYYIAKGIGKKLNIKIGENVLARTRYTQSQTTMTLVEREQNIKDAFVIKKSRGIKDKNLLLVDDVITTGATTSECGKVLLEAGAANIYAASLAIAD